MDGHPVGGFIEDIFNKYCLSGADIRANTTLYTKFTVDDDVIFALLDADRFLVAVLGPFLPTITNDNRAFFNAWCPARRNLAGLVVHEVDFFHCRSQ